MLAFSGLAFAAWGGCRSVDNAQIDLLERELRQQEDYIYELEDYLLQYSEKLRACRSAMATMKQSAAQQGAGTQGAAKSRKPGADAIPEPRLVEDAPSARRGGDAPQADPSPSRPDEPLKDAFDEPSAPPKTPNTAETSPPAATRGSEPLGPADASATEPQTPAPWPPQRPAEGETLPEPIPPPERTDPGKLEVPELEIGELGMAPAPRVPAAVASSRLGGGATADFAEGPLLIPHPADYVDDPAAAGSSGSQPALASEPIGRQEAAADVVGSPPPRPPRLEAANIEIRRVLAQPAEGDAESSLLVVLEVLSATQEPVEADGEVSLMVMSADAPGSLQRLERWDFTAAEAESSWQSSLLGDGLHLQLPLPLEELPDKPLELWARVVARDGRKMLAKVEFAVADLATLNRALAAAESETQAAAKPSTIDQQTPQPAAALPVRRGTRPGLADGGSNAEGVVPASTTWQPAASPAVVSEQGAGLPTEHAARTRDGWAPRKAASPVAPSAGSSPPPVGSPLDPTSRSARGLPSSGWQAHRS